MKPDELLELIDQAAREGWTELDLSNRGITKLPREIGRLTALEKLNLSYDWSELSEQNQLTGLPREIGRLTALTELNLSNNHIAALPPVIGQLINLQSLNLGCNHLTTLPPEIGQLAALQSLDLNGNRLTTLPPEIGQLFTLRYLNLYNNRLTTLPPEIGGLTALQKLSLSHNNLIALPPAIGQLINLQFLGISDNQLRALPPEIGGTTALAKLDLSDNHLTALPPEIGRLIALQSLNLSYNNLMTIPLEIGRLTALTMLHLNKNQLTALPPEIGQLTALSKLDLGDNQLTTLPSTIGQLTALQYLGLDSNKLTALPQEISRLTSLRQFFLHDNSSFPFPPEIIGNPNEPQAIIRGWLDYLSGRTRPLNEIKLVLVGEGSVGKTSLVNRLLYDTFDPNSGKTEGIAIHRWFPPSIPLQGGKKMGQIRVNVWDFGGQEIMHATHQFFLTKRTLYVLVLDSRYSEAENRLDYWLTLIRSFGGDSPILMVGNKIDQHPLDIDRRGLLAKHPTIQAILDTSCATGAGIPELRAAIAGQIARLPHVADPLVNTWFEVKAQLETLDADYIPYTDYVRLCCEKNVDNPDSQRVLLGFLHDLGVVFHFPDPRLETTNILNPEWVTQGVYRILNTRLPFAEPGILTWEMLACILDDEVYAEKRMFIVDMMQKFELCYELPDRKDTFLIPDLLPKEAPDTGVWSDALAFEIHYPVLPGSILTRLIVRMHRLIKERIAWRTGVLLACDGNEALIKTDLAANRLTIAVRGPGAGRRELLTRIREHLDPIHVSLVGLQADEKVPVPGHPNIPPVDYKWLRKLEWRGHKEFIPPGLEDPISVSTLLDGVELPAARREQETRGGDTYYQFYNSKVGVAGANADVDDGIHFDNTK